MTAPVLQAEGATATGVTTGVPSITIPTHQADDILVVDLMFWGPNTLTSMSDIPTPSTWNALGAQITAAGSPPDGKIARFWKRATGAGTTVTATRGSGWDTGTDTCYNGRAYVIRGCITTGDPWDAVTNAGPYTTANQNLPAITVSGAERLAIVFGASGDNLAFAMNGSGYTAGTVDADNGGTDSSFQTTRQDNVSGNISATASVVTATAAGPYGFIGVSFKPPVPPENYDASPTATGGGVVVEVGVKGASTAPAATGGGVTAIAKTSAHVATPTATGGGIAAVTETGAHVASPTATGGGTAALGTLANRQAAVVATGGGILTYDYAASSVENHDGTVVATGGGVAAVATQSARNVTPSATASGVATVAPASGRQSSPASVGGGVASVTQSSQRSTAAVGTGAGVVSPSVLAARMGAALMSGGGVLTAVQTTDRRVFPTATGAGVATVAAEADTGGQPTASVVATGGGVAVITVATGRPAAVAATGSGAVSLSVLSARQLAVAMTGGGVVVLTATTDGAPPALGLAAQMRIHAAPQFRPHIIAAHDAVPVILGGRRTP